MNNVSIVVDQNLCNGCCACISACTSNNICILFSKQLGHPVPLVANESCSGCGECLKSCKQSNYAALNMA